MDLQVKLADEGHAMAYLSPEAPKLPAWAVYKSMAYGTTYEPAVFIYNKRLVAADEVPADHAAFAKLISTKVDKFKGKVTTYDIEKSGVGFMFVVQDTKYFPGMIDLEKAFGGIDAGLEPCQPLERVGVQARERWVHVASSFRVRPRRRGDRARSPALPTASRRAPR